MQEVSFEELRRVVEAHTKWKFVSWSVEHLAASCCADRQDVNFPDSSLSGYLSISHLTDAHPHLTTFFTGEIIGPQHGFITGTKYGATEHDDMRHWGRFEQFRRPATRGDMMRPELLFRDPIPDRTRGETVAKERDFVFLRIKERFLVPDHTVRDISGASFAGESKRHNVLPYLELREGFYYAMVDLSPSPAGPEPMSPTSPVMKSPTSPTAPTLPRRTSASNEVRSPSRPAQSRRRQSSNKLPEVVQSEATIRGVSFSSTPQDSADRAIFTSLSRAVLFPLFGQYIPLFWVVNADSCRTKNPFKSSFSLMSHHEVAAPWRCVEPGCGGRF